MDTATTKSSKLSELKSAIIREPLIVNAGATLKFGELSVDGVIGNNAGTSVTDSGTTTQTGSANGTDSGVLRTDTLMSRVSMTYRF